MSIYPRNFVSTLVPAFTRWLVRLVALCGVGVLLTACDQAVYSKLDEPAANSIMLTLMKGGVSADKRADEGGTFSILVPESDLPQAIELLKADAQPGDHYASLGDVFSKEGLISSPTEERVRFMYGVQQELANTLSKIDGVLVARVHIVVPANDPFAIDAKPSSASVFIKHRPDANLKLQVPAIKDLVVRGVEGLSLDNVAVSLFPAESTALVQQSSLSRFFGIPVPRTALIQLWLMIAAPWLVVAALFVMLLHAVRIREWLSTWWSRDTAESTPGAGR